MDRGILYAMFLFTQGRQLPYIPVEIRQHIWKFCASSLILNVSPFCKLVLSLNLVDVS